MMSHVTIKEKINPKYLDLHETFSKKPKNRGTPCRCVKCHFEVKIRLHKGVSLKNKSCIICGNVGFERYTKHDQEQQNHKKHVTYQILSKIKELTDANVPASYPNLRHELPNLTQATIRHALMLLEDWVFIYSEYGDIGYGYRGRLYFIDETAPSEFQPSNNQKTNE
jgi:recombinational DNA repair protein (RecF pathway)